jgi:hypothetical protein
MLTLAAGVTACGSKETGGASSAKPEAGSAKPSTSAKPAAAKVEVVLPPINKQEQEPQTLGGKTLKGEICKFDKSGPVMKDESFSKALRDVAFAADGKIYVLDDEVKLRRYTNQSADGCELALDKSFGKDGILDVGLKRDDWHDSLSVDKAGAVYVSKGFGSGESKKVVDGKVTELCGEDLQTSPDSSVVMADLVQVKDGKCDGEKLALKGTELESPQVMSVYGDVLGVKGTIKEGDKNVIKGALFGLDGTQKALVGKADGDEDIFYAHDVFACSLGVCVVDGNASSLRVWKADGTFVGKVELDDVFGTDIMPQHGAEVKGALWISGSADGGKDDSKNDYGVIGRITGY